MTIKMIADMFFAQYNEIDINVEMVGGLHGHSKRFTKESFYQEYEPWFDEKVVTMAFQTHYLFNGELESKCERPILFMVYAE